MGPRRVSLMNTWFSVDETNKQFYVVEWRYGTDGQTIYNTFQPRIITMPIAPYPKTEGSAKVASGAKGRNAKGRPGGQPTHPGLLDEDARRPQRPAGKPTTRPVRIFSDRIS